MRYWAEYAWLPTGLAEAVTIEVTGSTIARVTADTARTGNILRGLTIPGFANGHSHAFHRALRGRTHGGRGDFWTWRDQMYAIAARLDPDSYYRLARGVYAEMVLAGYTSVGEFHYLHHAPGGVRYADPNAMGAALAAAADDAGIRLTLLDTCYLTGGFAQEPTSNQLRFGDGEVTAWAEREAAFDPKGEFVRKGVAAHSVRAVPAAALRTVAAQAAGRPLHIHLSEQPAENRDCLAAHGCTPTELLSEAGFLGPTTVAVHATHLTPTDIGLLAAAASSVCLCPTTERDLGDGIGPARDLADAGVRLCLGSDSNAIVDGPEEWRALELDDRLAGQERGRFRLDELFAAATAHESVGWPEAGRIAAGGAADLVTIDLESVRTAGVDPAAALYAATASDITEVLVAGRRTVSQRRHTRIENVETTLREEIRALWQS
ncbi:formimidoylglutamate deiminase [Nocardia panacis]|uniref:Formimidoylglutamate deiminase n=1 Tax=Nocardia panacis TaxID=2340916 RepID=A0A3A4JU70_9NOCA|nr:formimidoylglutamate deiminase [Nocardia panacis]RJO73596.1 formimidoylglutamate deiminase [Nocardia panacis]